jgi:hypothetical protein
MHKTHYADIDGGSIIYNQLKIHHNLTPHL